MIGFLVIGILGLLFIKFVKNKKRFLKRGLTLGFIGIFLVLLAILMANKTINQATNCRLFEQTSTIPPNPVGLLLGTSKYLPNGNINLYYKFRIEAATWLYKAGKIKHIIVSGDNGSKTYDEPTLMQQDLMKAGIPKSRIHLDYAGFRTLDSVLRCKLIFGQSNITIISQKFHNQRAIYIAKYHKINAVGFNANDVPNRYGLSTRIREHFARVKMFIDLAFGKEPKFLGKKITLH